jgi:hypothetical protein
MYGADYLPAANAGQKQSLAFVKLLETMHRAF